MAGVAFAHSIPSIPKLRTLVLCSNELSEATGNAFVISVLNLRNGLKLQLAGNPMSSVLIAKILG